MALGAPVTYQSGDLLAVRLSVRIVATGGGHQSGTARLWFNDAAANTRLTATVNGVARTFFLASGFSLTATQPSGPRAWIDVFVNRAVGGNPFKPFGTWSIGF